MMSMFRACRAAMVHTRTIQVPSQVNLEILSLMMKIPVKNLQSTLRDLDQEVNIASSLTPDLTELLLLEHGFFPEFEKQQEVKLIKRSPIVTIMGHVDHGKTTLLDSLRNSDICSTEFGKITQGIGAFTLKTSEGKITFIDTPGHHAFSKMRERGSQITDIVILVVSAVEGVKPQTIEAWGHAQLSPVIVAINKIDDDKSNVPKTEKQLFNAGIPIDKFGGNIPTVHISAKKKLNLDKLLETIHFQADLMDLKQIANCKAQGTIIEAKKNRAGNLCSILVQKGTLKQGDYIVCGQAYGKIRLMVNDYGESVREAGPADAVEIQGLKELPESGQKFTVTDNEFKASQLAKQSQTLFKKKLWEQNNNESSCSEKEITTKQLPIIIKADNVGMLEAIKDQIAQANKGDIFYDIISSSVGPVNQDDILLAHQSNAYIYGMNMFIPGKVAKEAVQKKVLLKNFKIIYHLLEDLEKLSEQLFKVTIEEIQIQGAAEVLATFSYKKKTVAGLKITSGKIKEKLKYQIRRGEEIIAKDLVVESLKINKEDRKEVEKGEECGLILKNFDDYQEGDIIEAY